MLHSADVVVCVVDITGDLSHLHVWIRELKGRRSDLDIFIFANKADRPRQVRSFDYNQQIYLTSINNLDSIYQAFDNIYDYLSKKHVKYVQACNMCDCVIS